MRHVTEEESKKLKIRKRMFNKKSKVLWISNYHLRGEHEFTFDKRKIYNLFADFPEKLTEEEIKLFCQEEPFWTDFFSARLRDYYESKKK